MRDNEKILNRKEDRKGIFIPILCAVAAVCVLAGILIWFGLKDPELFGKISDLVITLIIFIIFIFNTAVAVLLFFLSSRIDGARSSLDQALSAADVKVEELADKTIIVLGKILEPFIKVRSEKAGILSLFSKKKAEK